MKVLRYIFFLLLGLLISCDDSDILSPSENLTSVPILEFDFNEEDLIRLRQNRTNSLKVPARMAYGKQTHLVEVRASGAGSRYHPKWSYQVELIDGSLIEGLTEFNLSAQVFDPTLMHTNIASHLYKQLGFTLFRSKHVFVKINNQDEGLYPLIERVEEPFFDERNIKVYQLFKLGFDSKFTFTSINYPEFHFEKKIPDDDNFSQLYEFINAIDTSNSDRIFESLGKHLDVEQYIKYHAITTLMNSFDAFTNNFFLLKENPSAPFKLVPWDFDKIFQDDNISKLAGNNSIIKKIFKNDSTFNMYKRELQTQLDNIFTSEKLSGVIDSTANVIEEAYNLDPYLGKGGRYNFLTEIEELKSYINNRRSYFDNNIELLTKNYFDN